MEASITVKENIDTGDNASRGQLFDFESQQEQLKTLYANWQENVFTGSVTPNLSRLVLDIREDSDSSSKEQLLTEVSGYLASIALESESTSPLSAYTNSQSAVIDKAKTVDRRLSKELILDELLDAALDSVASSVENAEPTSGGVVVSLELYRGERSLRDEIPHEPAIEVAQVRIEVSDDDKGSHHTPKTYSEEEMQNLPPLASHRRADTFKAGQQVLSLVDGELVVATVKTAKAYKSSLTLGPELTITPKEIELRKSLLNRRQQELDKEGKPRLYPDPELLRLKMSLCPKFSQVIVNPSPGLLHLVFKDGDPGIITDMHHNDIIPMDAWHLIRQSDSYRESWLANGSKESLARRDILATAIDELIAFEESIGQPEKPVAAIGSNDSIENKRARIRKHILRAAYLSAKRLY